MKSIIFNLKKKEDFDKYYPLFYKWWRDWGMNPIHPNMLSRNGILVFNEDIPICAGWLFSTDSNTAIAGWTISAKEKPLRKGCIEFLIKELENLAKNLGFELLNFPASNPNLRNKLEKTGFGDFADKNITNYFKNLWERQYLQ